MDIAQQIRNFIAQNSLFQPDANDLDARASLIGAGVIDSTGVLELVAWLEEQFGISVEDAEVIPENLDTIAALGAYVGRKLTAPAPQATVSAAR
jgi:acyl carrier protein